MRALLPITATLAASNAAVDDAAPWAPGIYTAGQRVTSADRVWERAALGDSATAPQDDPLAWIEVGPTNRLALLDDRAGTATRASSNLTVTVAFAGQVTAVALLGVVGASVSAGGRTLALPAPVAPARAVDVLLDGISASGSLTVTITGAGEVSAGYLAVGRMHTLGITQPGPQVSHTSYTRRTTSLGITTVVPRGYSRQIQATVRVPAGEVDALRSLLTDARQRIGWWGVDERHECLQAVGYLKDWSIDLREVAYAVASISVEGLVRDDLAVAGGQVITGATRPGNVTGLRAGPALAGQVPLRWDAITDADYRETELRAGDAWDTAPVIFTGAADAYAWAPGEAGTYTVQARHRNRAGLESASSAAITVTLTPEDLATATSWDVEIESTNGDTFRVGQGTQTTLIAHAFKNGVNVTDVLPANRFRWRRVSRRPQPPPNDDERWNQLYATGYRQILISVDDVAALATFHCEILDA